jgi:DNA-binding response OmpR family regulator
MKVMVAEDEFLVALVLEEDLRANGHAVLGPYATVADAERAARAEDIDVAVLDINMAGTLAYPVADALRQRGIPYIFLSGYGPSALPEPHRAASCLTKPYELGTLLRAIGETARRQGGRD